MDIGKVIDTVRDWRRGIVGTIGRIAFYAIVGFVSGFLVRAWVGC